MLKTKSALFLTRSPKFGLLFDTLTTDPSKLIPASGEIVSIVIKRLSPLDKPDVVGYAVGGPGRTVLPQTFRLTEHDVRLCAQGIDFTRIQKCGLTVLSSVRV